MDHIKTVKVEFPSAPHLDAVFTYAFTGFTRVTHLVGIYQELQKKLDKKGRVWTHVSDILRSAVVLCHANLEQLLRAILLYEADWNPDRLRRVPLLSAEKSRSEKFSLADLQPFAEMTVDDLIFESVKESLDRKSFTCIEDVIDVIDACGLKTNRYKKYFPRLSEMMKRRHHIAHTGDIEIDKGRGKQITRSLSARKVDSWNAAAFDFAGVLSYELVQGTEQSEGGNSE